MSGVRFWRRRARKSEAEAANLQDEMEDLRRQLARARQPLEALKPLQEQVSELNEMAQKAVERQSVQEAAVRARCAWVIRCACARSKWMA